MPKLLAVSSSPRREGNSEVILEEFCRGAREQNWDTERVRVNSLTIRPCQACDRCGKNGRCIVRDDMQDLYQQIIDSDALVLAAPVFFGSIAAQAKTFIDRFQCWWHAKYNLKTPYIPEDAKRPGFFLCVGALKKKDFCESAASIVKVFFHNINHVYTGELLFRGYDEKGIIRDDQEAMEASYQAGAEFVKNISGISGRG